MEVEFWQKVEIDDNLDSEYLKNTAKKIQSEIQKTIWKNKGIVIDSGIQTKL